MILLLERFHPHFQAVTTGMLMQMNWSSLRQLYTVFLKREKLSFVSEGAAPCSQEMNLWSQILLPSRWACVHGSPSASSVLMACLGMANYSDLLWAWGKLADVSFPHAEDGLQDPKLLKLLANSTWYLFMVSCFPGPTNTIVPLCCS